MIQFYTWVKRTLEKRRDVFFYWLVPQWGWEQDKDWFPNDPNIKYLIVPQHKDRTKEYITPHSYLQDYISFNGVYWDFDVIVTVRTGLVPLMKLMMTSPRHNHAAWVKEVWVIENMPLMSFKESVALIYPVVQDQYTLNGVVAADRYMVMSYHEGPGMLQTAREYYQPSVIRELTAKIKPVVPCQFTDFALKSEVDRFHGKEGQQFGIAYAGRLTSSKTNIDKVYGAMTNQWIIRGGDKVRLLVCTTSVDTKHKAKPPEHMEIHRAPRDEFWRLIREDIHVVVIMHDEAGFTLTVAEPLMLGTPVVILKAAWAVGMLGPDYPFYVSNEAEAYTMCKCFYEDYEGMYSKFEAWFKGWFIPTYEQRFKTDLLYTVLDQYLWVFENKMPARYREKFASKEHNEIVQAIANGAGQEFVLFDLIQKLSDTGELRSLARKLDEEDSSSRGIVWATAWNDFRVALKVFHGYEDASVEVGHMRKVASV